MSRRSAQRAALTKGRARTMFIVHPRCRLLCPLPTPASTVLRGDTSVVRQRSDYVAVAPAVFSIVAGALLASAGGTDGRLCPCLGTGGFRSRFGLFVLSGERFRVETWELSAADVTTSKIKFIIYAPPKGREGLFEMSGPIDRPTDGDHTDAPKLTTTVTRKISCSVEFLATALQTIF